jgi:integrase
MMASASITVRTTKAGKRYTVRYRLGGRAYPVEHGGSFQTMREARIRRDLVAGELAAGRNPRILLDTLAAAPTPARTFDSVADEYRTSRIDLAPETTKRLAFHLNALRPFFGEMAPATITPADVQAWIASTTLKPSSIRRYMDTLRAVLDYAGVDPNPARSRHVRLPREDKAVLEPPSAAHVEAIVEACKPRWRLAVRTLVETGMRVGELHDLEWRDVDQAGSRFRIRSGKTRAARRWVGVPEPLMGDIVAETPPDDRTGERRVFPGATPMAIHKVVVRACERAGIPRFHPHDLRHRYASVQIARGVPVPNLAAQLGHAKNSITLDTYSHVLLDDG